MAELGAARLIVLTPSHYCEKARWALDLTGIKYVNEPHVPGVHRMYTSSYGGSTTPILITTDEKAFLESAHIVKYASDNSKTGVTLYGSNEDEKKEIEDFEEFLDKKLGPATRRVVYFHALDLPFISSLLSDGCPALESAAFSVGFFALKQLMKSGMQINEEEAKRSSVDIEMVFDEINKRISDGRKFLVGNSLSIADITFASLAAPILLPDEMIVYKKYEKEFPKEVTEISGKYRETPAGKFALRLFKEERMPKPTQ